MATKTNPTAKPRPEGRTLVTNARGGKNVVKPGDDRIITAIVPNPKKEGTDSHTRFSLYQEGQTVSAALAAGVKRADIKWDTDREFIKLAAPKS